MATSQLTIEDVKSEIRAVMREEMIKINTSITSIIAEKMKPVMEEVMAIKNSMDFINSEFEDMKRNFEGNNLLAKKLEIENTALRSEISELNVRLSQIEQHSRTKNLEIQCVPEVTSENLIKTVMQINKTIASGIAESDIHHCTRVAKLNKDSTRPRSIVVQFSSPRIRDQVLASTIKYNKAHPDDKLNTSHLGMAGVKNPVFIVEHLSAANKALHAAARIKAKALKYKFVWVKHGKIYARKTETSDYVLIRDMESLNGLK